MHWVSDIQFSYHNNASNIKSAESDDQDVGEVLKRVRGPDDR